MIAIGPIYVQPSYNFVGLRSVEKVERDFLKQIFPRLKHKHPSLGFFC